MPVWKATPVTMTPEILIRRYSLFRTERHEVHLVGYNATEAEGRVSSPLTSFNRRTRLARTRSGRRYRLDGDPGFDAEGLYVLDFWLRVNGVKAYDDVTELVLKSGLKAARKVPVPVHKQVVVKD